MFKTDRDVNPEHRHTTLPQCHNQPHVYQYPSWSRPPSPFEIDLSRRKKASYLLIVLLPTLLYPFTPFCWLNCFDCFDYFIANTYLVSAFYHQWLLGRITEPMRILMLDRSIDFVYHPGMYWYFVGLEMVMIAGVHWTRNEMLRRIASIAVVGMLWAIGYTAMSGKAKGHFWRFIGPIYAWVLLWWRVPESCGRRC